MRSIITGPLFKWYGSKWNASKHYPEPLTEKVFEPFAGSAGYSLRHFHREVELAERDIHLFPLWKWLIEEATEEKIREIPLDLPYGTDIRSLGLDRGQELLLKSWQRTNNVGNCWTTSPWCNKPGQWTANTRSRVASEFHLIKHWKVHPDGMSLLRDKKDLMTTWFIDAPYQYNYSYSGWTVKFEHLAEVVLSLSGKAIVCEAACPKTGLKPEWLPFVPFRETVTSRRKSHENHHSKELVFIK